MTYEEASPLPALQSQEEAQALVSRVLGSLIEYDSANGSDLVHSLSVFLETRRSWQRCAEVLNVHRQTVIYRMRRIEQLTERRLSETSDLAILWLALSAYNILRVDETGLLVLQEALPPTSHRRATVAAPHATGSLHVRVEEERTVPTSEEGVGHRPLA
jgi:hypothetical protein